MKKTLTRILFLWITISLIGVYAWKHYTMWDITFKGIEIPRPEFVHLFSDYTVSYERDEYGNDICRIRFYDGFEDYEDFYNYILYGIYSINNFQSFRSKPPQTPEEFFREGDADVCIALFSGRIGNIYFDSRFRPQGAIEEFIKRGEEMERGTFRCEIRFTTRQTY